MMFNPPVADSCTPQMDATKLRPDYISSVSWSGLFFCPAHEISPLLHSPSLVGGEANSEAFACVQKGYAGSWSASICGLGLHIKPSVTGKRGC